MKWFNYRDGGELQRGSVKQSIERMLGHSGKDYFTRLIKDINGVSADAYSTGASEALLRNAKVAAVGANMRVVLQQPTAYARAAAMIDPKYLTKAVFKKGDVAKAQQYSAIALWKSWGFFDLNLGKSMREIIVGDQSAAQKIREGSLWLAGKADDITWGTLWNACELEVLDTRPELKRGTEEFNNAVGERLSEVIDRTQVVDSVFHRSQLMRSKNTLVQLYTSFMSEPTKAYNLLRNAVVEYATNKDAASAKKLVRVASSYIATAVATAAFAAIADAFRDDDDEKEWMEKYVSAFTGNAIENVNPLTLIPGLKDVMSMLDGYRSSRLDLQAVERVINTARAWDKYLSGESKWNLYKLINQSAEALSSLSGIPAANLLRTFNSLYNTFSETGIDWESETSTVARSYETLYKAMIEGDTEKSAELYGALLADKIASISENEQKRVKEGKLPQYIDASSIESAARDAADGDLADALMNDPSIAAAYQYRSNANTAKLREIYKTLQGMGFSFNTITKAINKLENLSSAASKGKEYMQMSRYDNDNLFTAIRNAAITGNHADVTAIYDELIASSAAKDPAASLKSAVATAFRAEYVGYVSDGNTRAAEGLADVLKQFGYGQDDLDKWAKDFARDQMKDEYISYMDKGDTFNAERLENILTQRFGYTQDTLSGWVLDDTRDRMWEALSAGNAQSANEYISRQMSLGREQAALTRVITERYKTLVREAYASKNSAELHNLATMLASLALYDSDYAPYYSWKRIWGWIEDYLENGE